ncbi:AAA family ATPase [Flavobacterium aquatile]|uniref:Protein CR006 P-loop domain-containing protein n=1 Tax=Flavobacterium aquatile LMG 4008 = ATCC 11947 TaxID=1453498 RepID=A0A095SZ19_9FLAO|nr:AAA family ATPase [Flavobacterium aquatile]KGD69589.1 hypothetical protein LG45_02175 [Flavobacterium aquatile LMG 4008 = ATCC 11947]OXA67276.1 hypothetical protein B0A61_08705 [Flavobacterium aquatile LMG 4008 = ATCC 11947]GEC77935.1 hypothetical protein FAQ01_08050 [Flavobacterium aquatile]
MIHKIEKLISIGKFRNYQAAGQVNFLKLNLIYGDNGSGKTTLTSILRSLNTNNPQIVRSRISTNNTAVQSAQVIQLGTPQVFHTFGTAGWTRPLPEIEIFDIHFINDNIYSGFDFGDDHKKQLHQFVVGAQGVAIQQQIETNKTSKTALRASSASLEQQILAQVGNGLTSASLNSFLNLQLASAAGIAPLIVTATGTLASATANTAIQALPNLTLLSTINTNINFESLKVDLLATTDTIQDQTLQELFSTHCQDLSENGIHSPETWLKQGFEYLGNKQGKETEGDVLGCPFCRQELGNNLDIIRAYASLFNENFNALTQRIQNHLSDVEAFNLDVTLQSLANVNQTNSNSVASWSTHLPGTVTAPTYNAPNETALRAEYARVLAVIRQKTQNPSNAIVVDDVENFESSIQSINTNMTVYNQSVTNYNAGITTFKGGIQTVEQAQAEVDRLKRIQKRFEPAIDTLCTQLTTERQTLRALETAYTTLSAQQEAAATAFFTSYSGRINHYLGAVFKTAFQIEDVIHIAPRGGATQSKIGYKLTMDGKDISFVEGQPFSARECLSEGDKSTIALAFFLSKLDVDPQRIDKILVFDDPLSSLDTNRRTNTIGIIRALVPLMKQVIVLSHNEYFLHEIGKDFGGAQKRTLRVKENFAAKASILEVCDLDELVKNEYFRNIETLEAFRISPNHADKDIVLGLLRNVLEAHLRFKFYMDVRGMTTLQTFGNLITFLEASPVVFKDNVNRVTIIAQLRLINSVSWKPHHGTPSPDFATLTVNPATLTAPELDGLIQDTLRLINDQL